MEQTFKQRLRVLRQNYASDTGDFFIYTVQPLDEVRMTRHPKYRTYSIMHTSALFVGEVYDCDLIEGNRNGSPEYRVHRVRFDFPTGASDQWAFLARYCGNNSAKKLFKKLSETVPPHIHILSEMQNEAFLDDLMQKMAAFGLDDKLYKISNRILNSQAVATFVATLPEAIAEELSDFEAETLCKIQPNNPEESARIFVRDPWAAMKCEGFGFKRVDGLRRKLKSVDPNNIAYADDNAERVYYGAYDVVENRVFRNGHTYINTYEFRNLMVKDLGLDRSLVDNFIDHDYAVCDGIVPFFHLLIKDGLITSQRMYDAEELIYNTMKNSPAPVPITGWEESLAAYVEDKELKLTDEQMEIFKSVNENRFSLLTGPGGTGKTFTVAELIRFAKSRGLRVGLMAPTGKAAQVLKSYSGSKAYTIHTAFRIQPGRISSGAEVPATKPDIVVIDEFSMVDSELLGEMLSAYTNNDAKLPRFLFIGDENQLPSVGPGNLLHSFIKLNMLKLTRLTKVFRIKSELGGIVQLTEGLRKGQFPYKNNGGNWFTVGKDFIGKHVDTQDGAFQQSLAAYRKMLQVGIDPTEIVVLTPVNKGLTGQQNLNVVLQELARTVQGLDIDAPCRFYKQYGTTVRFYEGDLIMSLVNQKLFETWDQNSTLMDFREDDPTLAVSNGDVGRVTFIGHDFLLAEFDGTSVFIPDSELKQFQLGYSYTIHKSQGSEAKYGILIATSSDAYQLNANLLYTGASRFKEKLYLIGNYNTMRQRSKTFINQSRRTLFEVFETNENAVF